MRELFGRRANGLIKQMPDQRAAGLLTLALTLLKRRRWRRALDSFAKFACRPMYAPGVALERLNNRWRG
jgi:hypothetical protein